jgi:hypothetical protein
VGYSICACVWSGGGERERGGEGTWAAIRGCMLLALNLANLPGRWRAAAFAGEWPPSTAPLLLLADLDLDPLEVAPELRPLFLAGLLG